MQYIKPLFYYQTFKVIEVEDVKCGLIHRLIQLLIIGYVIGFTIIWEKGYQGSSPIIGHTQLKVKGNAWINITDPSIEPFGMSVWDAQDIVYPAKEANTVFIATNFWLRQGQTRGECAGDDKDEICASDTDCKPFAETTNGIVASPGQCLNIVNGTGYCNLMAWCPLEAEPEKPAKVENYLVGVEHFTTFFRSTVKYTSYDIERNNADKVEVGYNIFSLEDMLEQAGFTYDSIKGEGCVIGVFLDWACDFDKGKDNCLPEFSFVRLDDPNAGSSVGFNFRYVNKYKVDDGAGNLVQYRDLYKVFGTRVIVVLEGEGHRFDIVELTVAFGAGIALLGIATIISDMLLLYISKKREKYRAAKYDGVSKNMGSSSDVEYKAIKSDTEVQTLDENGKPMV